MSARQRCVCVCSFTFVPCAGLIQWHELLHHRQRHQLRIGVLRAESDRRAPRRALRRYSQQVTGRDVQCGREGVQIGVHESLRVRRWVRNADLGHPSRINRSRHARPPSPWNRSSSPHPRRQAKCAETVDCARAALCDQVHDPRFTQREPAHDRQPRRITQRPKQRGRRRGHNDSYTAA